MVRCIVGDWEMLDFVDAINDHGNGECIDVVEQWCNGEMRKKIEQWWSMQESKMMVRLRENETMMRLGDGEANKITNLVDKLLTRITNY